MTRIFRSTIAVAASLLAPACATRLDAPPNACGVLEANTGNSLFCDPPNRQQLDVRGTWEYQQCSYFSASSNYQSQVGLKCSGRLALCGDAGSSDITWQDVGPNGVGIGSKQDVQLSSFIDKGGDKVVLVFGEVTVTDPQQSCSAPVEVYLFCDLTTTTTATCSKVSYKISSACGVAPGWVESGFKFARVAECT